MVLGTQRIVGQSVGPYEQVYQVDAKKDLFDGNIALLHLKEPAHYTTMVKPMVTAT